MKSLERSLDQQPDSGTNPDLLAMAMSQPAPEKFNVRAKVLGWFPEVLPFITEVNLAMGLIIQCVT